MNNNQVISTIFTSTNTFGTKGEGTGKTTFNRKPDLTYNLERVLSRLNIEIEVEIIN